MPPFVPSLFLVQFCWFYSVLLSAVYCYQHMDCIQKIAVLLARVRHCLPRYMFQRLQTTTVKVCAALVTNNNLCKRTV